MAEEEVTNSGNNDDEGLSFTTAEELTTFLMDLQGQIGNMQETIDKLSPVEDEEVAEEVEETEERTEDEINEIDQLLQG